jgi:hypothetical protein
MNDFVTIATYDNYWNANLGKERLDGLGIPCYLADENNVTAQWLLGNALGGIKLRVPESFAAEATALLGEESDTLAVDHKIDENDGGLACPKCKSNNTAKQKLSKPVFALSLLLLGFPLPFVSKRRYTCFYCGNQWRAQ